MRRLHRQTSRGAAVSNSHMSGDEFYGPCPTGFDAKYRLDQWFSYDGFMHMLGMVAHSACDEQMRVMECALTLPNLQHIINAGLVKIRKSSNPTARPMHAWDGNDYSIPNPLTFFDDLRLLDAKQRLGDHKLDHRPWITIFGSDGL